MWQPTGLASGFGDPWFLIHRQQPPGPLAGDGTETADGAFVVTEVEPSTDATWRVFRRWPLRPRLLVWPSGEPNGRASSRLPRRVITRQAARDNEVGGACGNRTDRG